MRYNDYCTGCGLCKALELSDMKKGKNGFFVVSETDKEFSEKCEKICPMGGTQCSELDGNNIFGKNVNVYLGYSKNDEIRYKASSGGILTSLAIYLIEKQIVNGVIQTKKNPNNPTETITQCSKSTKEILECCGSRYSSSSPLINIMEYVGKKEKYAFIGKPCDVTALKNLAKTDKRINEIFPVMLSFFCAGTPSQAANNKMLSKMGIEPEECVDLSYRGNGWPGYATAIDKNGKKGELTYQEAWRDTLGREVRLGCRFCLDGIGEQADISCGDAWYIDKDKKPIFGEDNGRNVIFARTEYGNKIIQDAFKQGYINIDLYENYENELKYSQAYQVERRKIMKTMIFAMKLMNRSVPKYDKKLLNKYSKGVSIKFKFRRFLGIIKRVYNGKI